MACGCAAQNGNNGESGNGNSNADGIYGSSTKSFCGSCFLFWVLIALVAILVINQNGKK